MEERVKRILEYDKIMRQVADSTVSEPGFARCCALSPYTDAQAVQLSLSLTSEADAVWTRRGGNPMERFSDCEEILSRCAIGATPAQGDLLTVAQTLRAVRVVQRKILDAQAQEPLQSLAKQLQPFRMAEEEIFRCIRNEEELFDDASTELRNIRRKARIANEQLRTRLQAFITSSTYKNMLQDALVTQRNGRYVVPVKAEYAGAVKGLEHDRSASGSTVFIEPLAVLEANNELRELQAAERHEIERILQHLGKLVGQQQDAINASVQTMIQLDLCFAKAAWGRRHHAICPTIVQEDTLVLQAARHPLIDPQEVVPVDIMCGGQTRALIITGPNTGGKTVTLKTAGLFALLAQTGLYVPCTKAELPIFSAVFADIGDEQSIEQSLSTFSSHMVNLVEILQKTGRHCLVLVDELGAGTDPVEGAALAIAILQRLVEKGSLAIATTHYSELKSFAMTTPGFLNAGMEFDLESLRPTYRLLIGFAGSSNAFEISRRLGMPEDVIVCAKGHVEQGAASLEQALEAAEALRLQALKERDSARTAVQEERIRWRQEQQQAQRALEKEKKRAQELLHKAEQVLGRAREEADEAIEAARAAARAQTSAEREQHLQHARQARKNMQDIPSWQEKEPEGSIPKQLSVGDTVFVPKFHADATVLKQPDAKGNVYIQAGAMKISVPLQSLRVQPKAPKKVKASAAHVKRAHKETPMELDVRGMTVEEACMVVDQHLDQAVMNGMSLATIIHGKGTGALRTGVRNYLKRHPHVQNMRSGLYGEGEDGVTVVELK